MEVIPATTAQIAQFKVAAARRYKEHGVPAKMAETLFDRQLKKAAAELGMEANAPDDEDARSKRIKQQLILAAGILTGGALAQGIRPATRAIRGLIQKPKMQKVSSARVNAIAQSLSTELGLTKAALPVPAAAPAPAAPAPAAPAPAAPAPAAPAAGARTGPAGELLRKLTAMSATGK